MKVSLYFNDELWERFKKGVLRQTGDARSLSSRVGELILDSMLDDSVARGFRKMKVPTDYIDSGEVVPVRPSAPTSSGRAVRELRDSRRA